MDKDLSKILSDVKSVHLVGVGGIGLSRLAKWFLAQGKKVSGSDLISNEIVEDLITSGLTFHQGHDSANLPQDSDLVIKSEAIPEDNAELTEARNQKKQVISHFDALGAITKERYTVAVAGTNGKSTTTAMIGTILEDAGFDPTVFLGSKMTKWGGNLRLGKSDIVVVEADELNRQFLKLHPDIVVLTNAEKEHMDYFKDTTDLLAAFAEFVHRTPDKGVFVYNADDLGASSVAARILDRKKISVGKKAKDFILEGASTAVKKTKYQFKNNKVIFSGELSLPGRYNVYNALEALAASEAAHADLQKGIDALAKFSGLWRRFEKIGEFGERKTEIISDYAHHPTALEQMMSAAREYYGKSKVVMFYQPHQRKRTQEFFKEFVRVLASSPLDDIVITEIFDVSGREGETKISGNDLFVELSKHRSAVRYVANLQKSQDKVKEIIAKFDAALFVGAGDIYQVPLELIGK